MLATFLETMATRFHTSRLWNVADDISGHVAGTPKTVQVLTAKAARLLVESLKARDLFFPKAGDPRLYVCQAPNAFICVSSSVSILGPFWVLTAKAARLLVESLKARDLFFPKANPKFPSTARTSSSKLCCSSWRCSGSTSATRHATWDDLQLGTRRALVVKGRKRTKRVRQLRNAGAHT